MRNYENNFDDRDDERRTDWESVGDDDLERRRAERANRRYEQMQKSEKARASLVNKGKALILAAAFAVAVASGMAANGCSTHEIMDDSNRASNIEVINNVESVTLVNGPNIRRDPVIPNKEDGSTVLIDSGEEGQRARVPYEGVVYCYDNKYSQNGEWYGFPAEEFADELYENAFINQNQAEWLAKRDGDGVVWINGRYLEIDRGEAAHN